MAYRRGFRSEAEKLAVELRGELRCRNVNRLDVFALANHLAVPVVPLSGLAANPDSDVAAAVRTLAGGERSAFSAMTVFFGPRRLVVHNDAHAEVRQASNIAHELAHAILLHPSAPALDMRGCRNWNEDIEDEANFLGGAMLLPRVAAYWAVKIKMPLDDIAERFGISTELVQMRLNMTGAQRLRRAG